MDIEDQRYSNLAEFWPQYVREHSSPANRRLHFIGNTNLLIWLVFAAIRRSPAMIVFALVSSYAFAWIGHFVLERNVPATFRYPILAALGDIRMYILMWRGEMDAEVAQYTAD
jgi:hypothetical protein